MVACNDIGHDFRTLATSGAPDHVLLDKKYNRSFQPQQLKRFTKLV